MNEVNARRARLVPGWVTVFGCTFATKTNHSRFANFAAITRRQFEFPSRLQIWQRKYLFGADDNVVSYTISVCNKPTRGLVSGIAFQDTYATRISPIQQLQA